MPYGLRGVFGGNPTILPLGRGITQATGKQTNKMAFDYIAAKKGEGQRAQAKGHMQTSPPLSVFLSGEPDDDEDEKEKKKGPPEIGARKGKKKSKSPRMSPRDEAPPSFKKKERTEVTTSANVATTPVPIGSPLQRRYPTSFEIGTHRGRSHSALIRSLRKRRKKRAKTRT